MSWENVATLAELAEGPKVFKKSPRQIALFDVSGQIFAVDNRCPHEGYPLAEGTVDGNCVLTCNWHNWKFRLQDGECLLGGDHVRSYPTRVQDGSVWVNLADPAPEVIEAGILRGLRSAFDDRDTGRICREISRLHFHRLDPRGAVRKAIEWSHDRLEFGFTHALAACPDWLQLAGRFAGDWEKELICLSETVDHLAFDALRHKTYPYAEPRGEFQSETFLAAVEAEDVTQAEGLVRQGLSHGLHWSEMAPAFARAALMHFNDFGHSAIYVYKASQLTAALGPGVEPFLLPALARHLAYTTREDLLPEFKRYGEVLAAIGPPAEVDRRPLDAAGLFPATTREALQWVARNFPEQRPLTLYHALLEALAKNFLHFETAYQSAFDRPVGDNVGWLDFTHGVTFANAVRILCTQFPELWPQGLLQMACMLGRNRSYLDLSQDFSEWEVGDADRFIAETCENLLDHGQRDPIFSAHLVKTTIAIEEELVSSPLSCGSAMLAALNRFLHSPLKQKHVRRIARQAIELVARDFA